MPELLPLAEPYQATVLVGYLAEAFNPRAGRTVDVPPMENPLWPLAVRMVEAMHRDRYSMAAMADVGQYTPARRARERHAVRAASVESRQVGSRSTVRR